MKRKITAKKLKSLGIELIFEIIFGIAAFFIGWGILSLFGYNISMSDEGFDLAVLIGAVIFVVVIILVGIIINKIKSRN